MTLIYDRPISGPKTHVLILGIGRFPHMASANLGACVDSAKAMLDFVYAKRDQFLSPLATIECLISDPSVDAGQDQVAKTDVQFDPRTDQGVAAGTASNVTAACRAWMSRCQPGDSLIFYACTHGVADRTERGLLVLEDYPSSRFNPGEQLLDVASLARNVAPFTSAASVWMFIDACQETRPELLQLKEDVKAVEPVVVNVMQSVKCKVDTLALISSRFGNFARTKKSGVAFFTQSIIEGMSNNLVEQKAGKWWVTGKLIQHGLQLTALAKFGYNLEPSGLTSFMQDKRLLSIDEPVVPLLITSRPETFLANSTAAHIREDAAPNSILISKPPGTPEWRCHLPLVRQMLRVHLLNVTAEHNEPFYCEAPGIVLELRG